MFWNLCWHTLERLFCLASAGLEQMFWTNETHPRGAAQTPLALPYPFRTWPGSGTLAEQDKREERKLLYIGRYRPELLLDLGIFRAGTKKHMGRTFIFKVCIISKFCVLFHPHNTFFIITPRSVWHIVVQLLCRCFSISDFTVKYLCSNVRCLRGGPFSTQRHHYTRCPCRFFILKRYNLLLCRHRLWDRVNQTIAINQGMKQVKC